MLALLWLLPGCGTPKSLEQSGDQTVVPQKIVHGSQPITFYRVVIDIKNGTKLGTHYGGLFQHANGTYYWKLGTVVGGNTYRTAATEELEQSGFDVRGGKTLVFGDEESIKARFQLGATIKSIELNCCDPQCGNYTETRVETEWVLRDTFTRKTIFTYNNFGYVKESGPPVDNYVEAFRNALRRMVATSSFAEVVSVQPNAANSNLVDSLTIYNPQTNASLSLPADMDKVMQGALMIKAGAAIGSGFVVSADGYALTAAHLVSGLNDVSVKFKSGLELTAKVVRVDDTQDVALIKIAGAGLLPLSLALNHTPPVGSDIYAIGAPLGAEFTVTKGIVSGFRESDLKNTKYIQTDTPINLGNSGGPMLDASGKVVGIVVAKIRSLGVEGLAFGVPIDEASRQLGIKWTDE